MKTNQIIREKRKKLSLMQNKLQNFRVHPPLL